MKPTRSLVTPRLLGIVWPFIAVVLFQVLLGCVSLYMLSAVRGYVAGESLWSKGQKDAIHFLNLYADSRDPYTYAQYQQAIGVPQGDHALRVALEQSPPDLKAAREGALQGGNRPEDVAGIIWLYQNFRHLSFLDKAIQQWSVADGYLAKLDELALQMHGRISTEQVTADDTRQWKAQIDAINDAVTPLAYAFSEILGEASRFILQALLIVNLLTALVLICLALWRTHKILLQCRAFADALQLEKERAHVTLESIGDGVITTDTKGAITYMNPAAEQLTHWKFAQAQGLPLGALFKLLDENRADDGFTLIDQILRGRLAGSSEHSRLIQRMDATSVAVTLTGTPIRHAGALSGAVFLTLPQGLDSVVGRSGVRLSGGQRQRLAIARMVLAEPRVVILDEATSALDAATEYNLHHALGKFLSGRTTLIIAHRLSAVKQADRVLVFDGGSIAEDGEHHQLIAEGGLYAQLYGHLQQS